MQKLPTNNHTVVRSQDFERHTMGVAPESVNQVASYLRDGIYSDNILACVREYTTNALDEHTKLGIQRPVEVRLGLTEIKIRDFGLGLDKDGMFKIFGQLGVSGKRNDNTQAGCFGIGSSAAFSYSTSFTGVSIHDGIKSVYAFVLEDVDGCSVPTANLISEDFSDEPSGIEITIPIKKYDGARFKETARKLYTKSFENIDFQYYEDDVWNKVALDFEGIICEHVVTVEGHEIPFKIHNNNDVGATGSFVKMGPVCYAHHLSEVCSLITTHIMVEVPIGSIDLAISRESIKHTPKTTTFLDKVSTEIYKYITNLIKEFASKPTALDIFLSEQGELPKGNGWFKPNEIKTHIVLDNPLEFMKDKSNFYEEVSKTWAVRMRLSPYNKQYYNHNTYSRIVIIGDKSFGDKKLVHMEQTFNVNSKYCLFIKDNRNVEDIDESVRELVIDLREYEWPKTKREVKGVSERTLRARLSGTNGYVYHTEARWLELYGDLSIGGFVAWATKSEVEDCGYHGTGVFVVDTARSKAFAKKHGFIHINEWVKKNKNKYKKEIQRNSTGVYFEKLPWTIQGCFDKKLIEGKTISLEAQLAGAFITEKIEIELDKKAKKVQDLLEGNTLLSAAMKLMQHQPYQVPDKVKKQIIKTIELL